MKNIKYLFFGLLFAMTACQDPFELTPTDIISDAVVFEDEGLADAFLTDLYGRTLFNIKTGDSNFNMNLINTFGGESRNFAPWQAPFGQVMDIDFNEEGAKILTYWPYQLIRECNIYVEKLGESATLSDEYIAVRSAEARFIRAFSYFEMLKRYGGVPIITKALSVDATQEELFVPRNSEQEVYDFIGAEMDAIAAVLPEVADKNGRVAKWTALALKSRAMLYAASVANFGTVQLDGTLGIPSGEANSYYQQSLEASKAIMDGGAFALYRNSADPVENFMNLFLEEGNSEVIFAEIFDLEAGKVHSWDVTGSPAGFGLPWNSNYPTYLETLEQFDFVDGTTGQVDRAMYDDAAPIDPEWYFEQRDPRMRASIFYPSSKFRGETVYFHRSTDYTDPATGDVVRSTNAGAIPVATDGWVGKAHPRHIGGNGTGLLVRKMNNQDNPDGEKSGTDLIVFRLGEIMLNYVEAAFYLGDPNGDMATILNGEIRDRAGMPALDAADITEDKIRQERRCELAFESHTFWDLRRWRTAVEELDNVQRHRVHFRYNYDTGMYTIAIADGDKGRIRLHPERNYYYALGLERIADNPSLVENPGY